jgi:hypothetical protein
VTDGGELLARISADLRGLGARWALVGAVAVAIRSEPRFTRDIDIAVAVDTDVDAERLVSALGERSYDVVSSVEHESAQRLATVRLVPTAADATTTLGDLHALIEVATPVDIEAARQAVRLITDRGYNRSRDLDEALDSAIARSN